MSIPFGDLNSLDLTAVRSYEIFSGLLKSVEVMKGYVESRPVTRAWHRGHGRAQTQMRMSVHSKHLGAAEAANTYQYDRHRENLKKVQGAG